MLLLRGDEEDEKVVLEWTIELNEDEADNGPELLLLNDEENGELMLSWTVGFDEDGLDEDGLGEDELSADGLDEDELSADGLDSEPRALLEEKDEDVDTIAELELGGAT